MLERELKFFVPLDVITHLELSYAAVQTGSIRLHAIYFDTPEGHLAQAHVALRLRLEGENWVQTIKMAGPDTLTRVELNHDRPGPELDLSLYSDTAVANMLETHKKNIQARYETRIHRRLALRRLEHGAELEMAWDTGHIVAGDLQLPVNELEVELLKGPVHAMFDLGEQWQYKHRLILELRSKSERGHALARLSDKVRVNKAKAQQARNDTASELARKAYSITRLHTVESESIETFYRQSAALSLEQVIRNASLLAGIDDIRPGAQRQADYLAAMRVGLRRLRSCRKLFKPWLSQTELHSDKQLHYYFALFGHARDYDMVHLEVTPLLLKAGMPAPAPQIEHAQPLHDPVELARAAEFQSLLLRTLQELLTGNVMQRRDECPPHVGQRIERWFRLIQRGSQHFDQLSPEKQHQLRNRIKTLRYCLEFSSRADTSLHRVLRDSQNLIGHVTDMDVALDWYARHALSPEQAIFAQHWLTKARRTRVIKAQQALRALAVHQTRQSGLQTLV